MPNLKLNVDRIRKARGLSEDELSARLGMAKGDLAEFLRLPPKRKEGVLHKLSRELVVPEVLLFADDFDVADTRIPDFRLSHPAAGGYSRETLRWIDFAEAIRAEAHRVGEADRPTSLSDLIDSKAPIPQSAERLREILNFTEDAQLGFKNARLMFSALRQRIESLNVFVLQLSFPETDGTGFCLAGDVYDVIVINTRKQSPARRAFTLGHEVYHCALGETGLSDSRLVNNSVERRCNSFAAHFLAPTNLVQYVARKHITGTRLQIGELRAVADELNISMHATLLRLVELGIYHQNAITAWKSYIRDHGDPEAPKRGGGRRVEEWKYKLARYGFKFASVFGSAKNRGEFDDLEFYQFSGIKPKYQSSYIDNGSRASPEDADVDDEGENA
jgi:Zn-dependent peptidase ImmA (M78 family)